MSVEDLQSRLRTFESYYWNMPITNEVLYGLLDLKADISIKELDLFKMYGKIGSSDMKALVELERKVMNKLSFLMDAYKGTDRK